MLPSYHNNNEKQCPQPYYLIVNKQNALRGYMVELAVKTGPQTPVDYFSATYSR